MTTDAQFPLDLTGVTLNRIDPPFEGWSWYFRFPDGDTMNVEEDAAHTLIWGLTGVDPDDL